MLKPATRESTRYKRVWDAGHAEGVAEISTAMDWAIRSGVKFAYDTELARWMARDGTGSASSVTTCDDLGVLVWMLHLRSKR